MSNNLEIVMSIDTLEIFEVIDLDETIEATNEVVPEAMETSPYDDLDEVFTTEENKEHSKLSNQPFSDKPDYHSPSCILWEIKEGKVIHTLGYRNKHGSYPYHSREPSHWGHVSQLTPEEALWKTLELNPELMSYV